ATHPPDVLFVPAHSVPPILPHASVTTIHDLGYLHFPGEHPPAARWLRRQANRWSARRASSVIAISGATRDDLIHYERLAPAKITVVHHGCGPGFKPAEQPAIDAVRERFSLPDRYLLFVGT